MVTGWCYRRDMFRLLGLLFGVALALSLTMGGAAHVAEQICVPTMEAQIDGHTDDDGDQAPHSDGGVAHHHGGCHGHHNVAPFEEPGFRISFALPTDVVAFETTLGASAPPGASLRPPIV